MRHIVVTPLVIAALLCAAAQGFARSLDEIESSGVLNVVTTRPAEPEALPREVMPEDYELSLLEGFARKNDLALNTIRVKSQPEMLKALADGKADLAAALIAKSPELEAQADFTKPFAFSSSQIVVKAADAAAFKGVKSLEGEKIYVMPDGVSGKRAQELRKSVNGLVVELAPAGMEKDAFLLKVASGEYPFAIADERVVRGFLGYNDGIRDVYKFPENVEIAWALPKGKSPELLESLNAFIKDSVPCHQLRVYKEDLPELKKRGFIRVLTRNNPYSYCLHNGALIGFEYELAREFAKRNGLHAIFVVPPEWQELMPWLRDGRGEIVAACLSDSDGRKAEKDLELCPPYCEVSEMIIGRSGEKLKSAKDLAGRKLAVRKSSAYWESAVKLKDSGVDMKLIAAPEDYETYEILNQIESGNYDFTLCDDKIANVELKFRPKLAALGALPGKRHYVWMVRGASPELKAALESFFEKARKDGTIKVLLNKYFSRDEAAAQARLAEVAEDRLKFMPYRELIEKYSERYGFHWCLVAAQILQESRFNQKALSSSGAVGLMQLKPSTAAEMGFASISEPEANIHAGIKYLDSLRGRAFFENLEPFDRLCFALASYNGGMGHLLDARMIAKQEGLDPDKWLDNVEKAYGLLGEERYSRNARYGACRSGEITGYVRNIILYYRMYLRENGGVAPTVELPKDSMPQAAAR